MDDTSRILLGTLCMSDTTLIWWDNWTQANLFQHGQTISFWVEFIVALRKKIYPLAYMQRAMIDQKPLRQAIGKNVQGYTQQFKKQALSLGIRLYTCKTLIQYVGRLHSYL